MMVTLAVTGGIGSGKSFITRMLSVMGYPLYDTDRETRRLYSDSAELRSAIRSILGDSVFLPDGNINRSAMASAVFSNSGLLREVEAAVYPLLSRHLDSWIEEHRSQGCGLSVIESALILEKEQFRKKADFVLTVSAPEELRVKRAMKRDGSDSKPVIERMKCQNSDAWRRERADYEVINDGRSLLPQLSRVIDEITFRG